jgi:hypothetical protein
MQSSKNGRKLLMKKLTSTLQMLLCSLCVVGTLALTGCNADGLSGSDLGSALEESGGSKGSSLDRPADHNNYRSGGGSKGSSLDRPADHNSYRSGGGSKGSSLDRPADHNNYRSGGGSKGSSLDRPADHNN